MCSSGFLRYCRVCGMIGSPQEVFYDILCYLVVWNDITEQHIMVCYGKI